MGLFKTMIGFLSCSQLPDLPHTGGMCLLLTVAAVIITLANLYKCRYEIVNFPKKYDVSLDEMTTWRI
jgi:hypothetical protein